MTEDAIRSFAMTLPYVVDFDEVAEPNRNPSCNNGICGAGCGGGGGTKKK